jgi:hypothetical protein
MMTRVQELGRLFWRNAKESGEAAAEAIEQHAQVQRLALQVRKLDKERSVLIGQIGAKVYSLHGRGKVRNQDVLGDCKRIDEIIADITKLQKDIELIRAASLEKGIEVPILSDEAPLDEEETITVPSTPAVITPVGTFGEQDLPEGGPGKSSVGRQEFDESGDSLMCDTGPSTLSDPTECEVEVELSESADEPSITPPAG